MKKKWRKQQGRVKCLFEKWTYLLGLKWWHVTVLYTIDKEPKNEVENTYLFGRAIVRWQYAWASIEINLYIASLKTDKELELAIVHELTHVLVNEMRESDPDGKHEERVCTGLAKAFLWTRDIGEGAWIE